MISIFNIIYVCFLLLLLLGKLIQDRSTRQRISEHGGLELKYSSFFFVRLDHRAHLPATKFLESGPGLRSNRTIWRLDVFHHVIHRSGLSFAGRHSGCKSTGCDHTSKLSKVLTD